MNQNTHTLTLYEADLELLPQRAVYWKQENTLLVADVHLGKEHAFGRQGIAIPAGSSERTLRNLSLCLKNTSANECIVLGDFFHDTPVASDSWLVSIREFLDEHPDVTFTIVAGNHDKILGQGKIDTRINWHNKPIQRGPFVLQHEPGKDARGYVLAGHIHPVISIGKAFQRQVSGRCFWQQADCLVFPAFGEFTGGFRVTPTKQDAVYMIGSQSVIPIPTSAIQNKRRRATRMEH